MKPEERKEEKKEGNTGMTPQMTKHDYMHSLVPEGMSCWDWNALRYLPSGYIFECHAIPPKHEYRYYSDYAIFIRKSGDKIYLEYRVVKFIPPYPDEVEIIEDMDEAIRLMMRLPRLSDGLKWCRGRIDKW